jgi:transcriptional regulator with XRE-family HTH domain
MVTAADPVVDIHQDGFPTRLRHAISLFGGATAISKVIGRSEGAVRKWLRGDSEPGVSDLRAICRACGANAQWLVTGEGDSGLIPPGVREPTPRYALTNAVNDGLLEEIMTAVDEASLKSGAKIAINRKSTLVTALYGLCLSSGVVDRGAVLRLMRLAA